MISGTLFHKSPRLIFASCILSSSMSVKINIHRTTRCLQKISEKVRRKLLIIIIIMIIITIISTHLFLEKDFECVCVHLHSYPFWGPSYDNPPTHTPRTLNLPRTQTWVLGKHWLKTPKTSCFTILWGSALRGLQWTSSITIYLRTHESSEVFVIHREGGGCVCVSLWSTIRIISKLIISVFFSLFFSQDCNPLKTTILQLMSLETEQQSQMQFTHQFLRKLY